MNNVYKGKAKLISASMVMVLFALVMMVNASKRHYNKEFYKILTYDTVPTTSKLIELSKKPVQPKTLTNSSGAADTIPVTDTIQNKQVDSFNVKISKDTLSAPVYYHADDSVVVDVPNNKIMLYGKKSSVKYEDNNLTAPGIVFDQKNNMMTAFLRRDSTGKVLDFPTYKSKDFLSQSDSIRVNMKNGKGMTKGTYTQQGEMYVFGEKIKKIDKDVFYAYRSRITTCNLDTPHFAFVSKKIKFINGKFAITGPVHPEFEGVPIPLYLPFGIYPMYNGRHSGLMAPSFTSTAQFGLALENLGYYKVLGDNWDVTTLGTFYSYGGWTLKLSPRYYKRYRYQGSFSFDYQHTKYNFKGDPDFQIINSFKITWSHNTDTRARPGVTFGASVNAGSSSFNKNVATSPVVNFQNVLTSSINYAKVWKDKPFNIAISANHSQNTVTNSFNVTLPNVNFNVQTLYPFRNPESVGTLKWYENIGVGLNTLAVNQTTFYDDSITLKHTPIGKQIFDNMQWGARHNIPISLSLPPIGAVQISPGVSYSETWYQNKSVQTWNDSTKQLDTTTQKGFYTGRSMSFSIGLTSRLFGMFTFGKKSSVKAIRHEIRPTFSLSYSPDLNKNSYYYTQVDSYGTKEYLSYYGVKNVNPAYSRGRFGGTSFGIDNIVQMKVRDKKDTSADATKKVTLLDGLSISSAYNFLAPKFKLSPFSISARTNLFNKINISAQGSLDPYLHDTLGNDIDRLVWKEKTLTLGRLTNGGISVSTSFQGGEKEKKQRNEQLKNGVNPVTGMPLTEDQTEAAYIGTHPGQFTDFSIPWSLQFGYSLQYSQTFIIAEQRYKSNLSSNINASGSLKLTEKWQVGITSYYNFSQGQVGMLSLSIAREMHCWQMTISVSPIGINKFFSINISPKSPLLRDIKVNRTKYFYNEN